MTREQAKQILLKSIEKEIKKYGEDTVAVMSPMPGKNFWTYKEYKDAVINDTDLDGCEDSNPIDSLIRYDEYRLERGMESMVDKFLKEK
jgi:hypothetical protein